MKLKKLIKTERERESSEKYFQMKLNQEEKLDENEGLLTEPSSIKIGKI